MLIIYVARRKYFVSNSYNEPLKMSNLPQKISGNDNFDNTSIDYDDIINVAGKNLHLRSVVCTNIESISVNNLTHINSGTFCLFRSIDGTKKY